MRHYSEGFTYINILKIDIIISSSMFYRCESWGMENISSLLNK